jgi:hypothetical protein
MPMRFPAFRGVLAVAMTLSASATLSNAQSAVGIFDAQSDIGRARHAGSASYNT